VSKHPATEEKHVKSDEEIMEILEAFDLTRSFRDAGELAGCSPNTVAHWVGARDAGTLHSPARREQLIDPFLIKVEEWVEASKAKVRADIALGYGGSERTTRRAVAAAKKAYRDGRRRIYRPWVTEPGMWFHRLRTGPGGGRKADAAVLRLAVVVAVPGGDPHHGQVPAHRHRLHRHRPAPLRRLCRSSLSRRVLVEDTGDQQLRVIAAREMGGRSSRARRNAARRSLG